jgi:hypothetical protein
MFGHQDNNQQQQSDQNDLANNYQYQNGTQPQSDINSVAAASDPPDAPSVKDAPHWQHPGTALDHDHTNGSKDEVISPAGGFPKPLSSKDPSTFNPAVQPPKEDNKLVDATNEDLIDIKKKALEELFPLIDKLDQAPSEHFKTLMMIIQASDNDALIAKAYQIAQTIDEDKMRAQALLDIVNEINYFTQQPEV